MKSHLTAMVLTLVTAAWARGAMVTYTSTADYFIHDGPAFFPQSLEVSGLSDPIAEIRISFLGLTHETPGDIDALLVGPGGQTVMLMSDTGEPAISPEVTDLQLDFRDGASPLPQTQKLVSGAFAPTNYVGFGEIPEMDQITPNPPPLGPYGATFSVFNGSNPNGTWTLYIQDDRDDDSGALSRWSLTVTTVPEPSSAALLLFGVAGLVCRTRTSR
jgi:hypothetical protein